MRTVERWFEFSLAYGLAIIGSATASMCSFWSAAGPYDIVKGVGLLFLIVFVGCRGLAWTRKASQRAGLFGGLSAPLRS